MTLMEQIEPALDGVLVPRGFIKTDRRPIDGTGFTLDYGRPRPGTSDDVVAFHQASEQDLLRLDLGLASEATHPFTVAARHLGWEGGANAVGLLDACLAAKPPNPLWDEIMEQASKYFWRSGIGHSDTFAGVVRDDGFWWLVTDDPAEVGPVVADMVRVLDGYALSWFDTPEVAVLNPSASAPGAAPHKDLPAFLRQAYARGAELARSRGDTLRAAAFDRARAMLDREDGR